MAWPSQNVPRGGILHPAKTSYCPETHQFLKLLLDESKLSMTQKKKFNYYLRNGEPLPPSPSSVSRNNPQMPTVSIRPGSSKRRSRDAIVNSGAYERDKFYPMKPIVDREKEKEKLQNKMAFSEDIKVTKARINEKMKKKYEVDDDMNRFDQIVQEIKERKEWLKEMEALGLGKKYREIINQQIQQKINEMNKLKRLIN